MVADPVGVLLPAGGLLSMQALGGWGAYALAPMAWEAPRKVALVLVGYVLLRAGVAAPLRALLIAAGGRGLGYPARGLPRAVSLFGLHLVLAPLQIAAFGVCAVAGSVASTLMLGHGWPTTAALLLFLGLLAGTLASLLVRAVFAYAAIDVVVGGGSAVGALGRSARRGARDTGAALGLLALSDAAVALGALACGVGALPGYPLGDLAVLHRWHLARTAPRSAG